MTKRIRKQKPKPHVVVPDTSTLWHDDKHHVVDPRFEKFWHAYASPFSLELRIPEVVKGELLFQQTTSAFKSLKRVNAAIEEVQCVTHKKYSHRITDTRVRQEVEAKFDHWNAVKHATIVPTPTNVIVWPELIQKAVWREPPFEPDHKNTDQEKGFRDALILETLVNDCATDSRDILIAFLCKDRLLRETAEARLAADSRVTAYELIEDFKTYLDLTNEKLEDAFIRGIIKRASEKFFSKGDERCLYFRDSVKSILQEKYKRYFENPEESEDRAFGLIFPSGLDRWSPLDGGTYWISRSRFVETDDEGQYVWQNTVTFVRQYTRTDAFTSHEERETKEVRVLILPCLITWRARVTSDGRFWEYSYVDDKMEGNTFRARTDDDISEWNLDG